MNEKTKIQALKFLDGLQSVLGSLWDGVIYILKSLLGLVLFVIRGVVELAIAIVLCGIVAIFPAVLWGSIFGFAGWVVAMAFTGGAAALNFWMTLQGFIIVVWAIEFLYKLYKGLDALSRVKQTNHTKRLFG